MGEDVQASVLRTTQEERDSTRAEAISASRKAQVVSVPISGLLCLLDDADTAEHMLRAGDAGLGGKEPGQFAYEAAGFAFWEKTDEASKKLWHGIEAGIVRALASLSTGDHDG